MTERHPADPADGDYVLDTVTTKLSFRAKAFRLKWVAGTLQPIAGLISVRGRTVSGHGVATTASVDTGLRSRDWHLRTSHYLDVRRHPEVRLRVDEYLLGSPYADAKLEVRGRSVPLRAEIKEFGMLGDQLRLRLAGRFDRRRTGMLPPLAGVSRLVSLDLTIVASPAGAAR